MPPVVFPPPPPVPKPTKGFILLSSNYKLTILNKYTQYNVKINNSKFSAEND